MPSAPTRSASCPGVARTWIRWPAEASTFAPADASFPLALATFEASTMTRMRSPTTLRPDRLARVSDSVSPATCKS